MIDLAKGLGCLALIAAAALAIVITSALGTLWLIGWLP